MHQGERFNSITHLVGTVFSVVGTIVLVVIAARHGSAMDVVAMSIYGTTLILLYLISTLYHSLKGKAKHVFHVLDHCGIYLLIAGTYTPFALLLLGGEQGWLIFTIVWTLAAIGVFKDWRFHRRYRPISYVLYIGMGWMIVFFWNALEASLPTPGIVWLFAGGVFYTAGLTFLGLSKRVAHTHGIWHICVMAGSLCHFIVMLLYVAPGA